MEVDSLTMKNDKLERSTVISNIISTRTKITFNRKKTLRRSKLSFVKALLTGSNTKEKAAKTEDR